MLDLKIFLSLYEKSKFFQLTFYITLKISVIVVCHLRAFKIPSSFILIISHFFASSSISSTEAQDLINFLISLLKDNISNIPILHLYPELLHFSHQAQ